MFEAIGVGALVLLFIGDDWAEDHHDIELEDETGRRIAKTRLTEGLAGIAALHMLVSANAPADWADLSATEAAARVVVGIETDRGPWVQALLAAGYQVYAINPLSSARYRQRHSTSGAKSDAGDAHVLAEIVRLDREHHRQIAGDTDLAEAVKLLARAHQTAIWDRTRQVLRLRSALLQYFPAAVAAFPDLSAKDSLILLGRAPSPRRAAKLTRSQIVAALTAAGRHHVQAKADVLRAALQAPGLRQPDTVDNAFAAIVASQVAVITAVNEQIKRLEEVMTENFERHPAAEIYLSQPGLGGVLGARALGEFGDDPHRFADARSRKNYSGQSPITRASGKKSVVLARYATNRRLGAALHLQAFASLSGSPGARAYYDAMRARNIGHHAALRHHHELPTPQPTSSTSDLALRHQITNNRWSHYILTRREPPRRHLARLPENGHHLRRTHRVGTPSHGIPARRSLTPNGMGCLTPSTSNPPSSRGSRLGRR